MKLTRAKFWKGAGCEECRQLGYQGRMGIYELLFMDEEIRSLILTRASSSAIAAKAMENGMKTLRNDGWKKVKAAKTTIEEVIRVTQTEEHFKSLMEDPNKPRG
jgi:type II secretory ATPase GspE/PulE/Tfp pilus assembly ATPase PilB-like protein